MRIQTLVAGVCAAAILPTAALAQQSCEQLQNSRVTGTVLGAGVGALAGGAVAGRDDRSKGAIVGGLAGALIGNQIAKSQNDKARADCARAYGYYDNAGAWHANGVTNVAAQGYFDRNGVWVDGVPRGHYDRDGRWVQASTDTSVAGYYDNQRQWVPASANGYYSNDGTFVAAAAPGYYDRQGRWVAGPTTGSYTPDGQWVAGRPNGQRDANGVWRENPQPGYYDNGRWVRGEAIGYYDARGRWISTDDRRQQPVNYPQNAMSIDEREANIAERIRRNLDNGRMTRQEGREAMRSLSAIEREEQSLRGRNGRLGPRAQATINARLDVLSANIREDARDGRRDRVGSR